MGHMPIIQLSFIVGLMIDGGLLQKRSGSLVFNMFDRSFRPVGRDRSHG
jgi:hypothetical protein